ncbi:MAG TPA: HAMP domain-containing protein, partial [Thermodesulfobacteriota bacterium]|nr:HAMP domain-containing protein [Thermodesulfobacteriota bacterium]
MNKDMRNIFRLSPGKIKGPRIPIRTQLSLAMTLVVVVTILVLGFTILTRQKEQLFSQTIKTGKVTLSHFAKNANIPLLNDDIVRLNQLIKDAASVEGIVYAAIVDRNHIIKAHMDAKQIGQRLKTPEGKESGREGDLAYYHDSLPSGTRVLNLSRPVTFRDKTLGAVHIGLSLDFIDHLIRQERLYILVLSVIVVLLGIGVSVLLAVGFSRPITRLASAAREVGKGNLTCRVEMNRKDEFGDLASAFNEMTDELNRKETANARLLAERDSAEKEARKLEEQLWQSQKMEAVGQLAGGIAHDFNNSLTLIKVCSQLALQELNTEDPVRDKIKQIDEATGRSGDLARQLLTFSRRQVVQAKVID